MLNSSKMPSFFTVAFVIVLLSGSEAFLPEVGSCSFMEYFCDARKCMTVFVKGLQSDPTGDCGAKYNKAIRCVLKTNKLCLGDTLPESILEGMVREKFKENTMCSEGPVGIPVVPDTVSSHCSSSFSSDLNSCLKSFHEKFAADKADPSLCREQAKATKCLKDLIMTNCTLPPEVQEAWDLGFGDYNPYCANIRDPGATGNDTCFGVKDLDNPSTKFLRNNSTSTVNFNSDTLNNPSNKTDIPSNNTVDNDSSNKPPNKENAAAVLKVSALQALLSFVSLFFVYKI